MIKAAKRRSCSQHSLYLLNSRPLTYQTADPEDDVSLTPNYFLLGQVGGRFALETDTQESYNLKKRWRRTSRINKAFLALMDD